MSKEREWKGGLLWQELIRMDNAYILRFFLSCILLISMMILLLKTNGKVT